MTEQDHELLSQYLDGELGAPQVLALESRLATEPTLQAHLRQLRQVNETIQSAFNVPGADRVPSRVAQLLRRPASNVVAFPQRRRAAWGFAVAASLMAASGILFFEQSSPDTDNHSLAGNLLAQELENTPSRSDGWDLLADGRQIRPILSFHSKRDGWCREYLVSEQGEYWRGVACKAEEQWVTVVYSQEDATGASTDYRPAGASASNEVQNFVQTQADNIALSAKQEAQLIDRGWQ